VTTQGNVPMCCGKRATPYHRQWFSRWPEPSSRRLPCYERGYRDAGFAAERASQAAMRKEFVRLRARPNWI